MRWPCPHSYRRSRYREVFCGKFRKHSQVNSFRWRLLLFRGQITRSFSPGEPLSGDRFGGMVLRGRSPVLQVDRFARQPHLKRHDSCSKGQTYQHPQIPFNRAHMAFNSRYLGYSGAPWCTKVFHIPPKSRPARWRNWWRRTWSTTPKTTASFLCPRRPAASL